jgi:hypothetical protein
VIFKLHASELADWQEAWCAECVHDHWWSHLGHDQERDGCPILRSVACGEDVPAFIDRSGGVHYVPAMVECLAFTQCEAPECQSDEVAGFPPMTHREWAQWQRTTTRSGTPLECEQ